MAIAGMGARIVLPRPGPRPWGKFTDVASEISLIRSGVEGQPADRTAFGARFMASGAIVPIVVDFNCEYEYEDKESNVTLAEVEQVAFQFHNAFDCSAITADPDELSAFLAWVYRAGRSEALTRSILFGVAPESSNLDNDSTALPTVSGANAALTAIELGLAERLSNQQGTIFISRTSLGPLVYTGAVRLIGGQLVTLWGNLVISDAGHTDQDMMYGTGPVAYSLSRELDFDGPSFDLARNNLEWWLEQWGVTFFNPEWSVRVEIEDNAPLPDFGLLAGVITDDENGAPLEGASVTAESE